MPPAERAEVFKWATGFAALPPYGFSKLPRRLTLLPSAGSASGGGSGGGSGSGSAGGSDVLSALPQARTCFSEVAIPAFASAAQALAAVRRSILEASAAQGDEDEFEAAQRRVQQDLHKAIAEVLSLSARLHPASVAWSCNRKLTPHARLLAFCNNRTHRTHRTQQAL